MKQLRELYQFYKRHVSVEDTTSLAYYFILSLVPAATILTVLAQQLHIDLSSLSSWITTIFNENIAVFIITAFSSRDVSAYSLITLIISLYVCSKGVYRVTRTVNYMYEVDPGPRIPARIHSLIDTFLLLILILGLIILITVLPLLFEVLNLGPIWNLIKYAGGFLFIFIIMLIEGKLVPFVRLSFKEVYKGALVTSVLFLLIILGFSIYLMFANYTTIYGPFASLAVLLMIFDFFAKAIYLGFAINAFDKLRNM